MLKSTLSNAFIEFFVVKGLKKSLIIVNSRPEYDLFLTIPSYS